MRANQELCWGVAPLYQCTVFLFKWSGEERLYSESSRRLEIGMIDYFLPPSALYILFYLKGTIGFSILSLSIFIKGMGYQVQITNVALVGTMLDGSSFKSIKRSLCFFRVPAFCFHPRKRCLVHPSLLCFASLISCSPDVTLDCVGHSLCFRNYTALPPPPPPPPSQHVRCFLCLFARFHLALSHSQGWLCLSH